jgi:ABC-type multidrug transport system fused ATPase/permease subunit
MAPTDPPIPPTGLLTQVRRVTALVVAERTPYLIGAIFVAVSTVTSLAYPYVVRLIIDDALQGGRLDLLGRFSLIMVGILVAEAIAVCGRSYWFGLGAERITMRLQRLVFRSLLEQDIQFFDGRDVGDITTRLWADLPSLELALGEDFAETLRAVVFCICGSGLLFYTSPWLALLMLLALPPIAGATSFLGRRVKGLAAQVQYARAEAGAAATEILSGVRTVRAFAQEQEEQTRFDRHGARALGFARQQIRAKAALAGVSLIAGECAALLAIWVGGNMIVSGRMSTGALISFILYALLVAKGFRQGSRFTAESLRAIGAAQWAFDLVARPPIIPVSGGLSPADADNSIRFERLHFRYPSRPDVPALRGIDLHIEAGEVIALVGASGSGKSTLLNLVLRFYDPQEGRVLVGGYDVRQLDPSWLRKQVATVMQEPTLFSRTIAQNIGYGVIDADAAQIARAAELAAATEFIQRIPGGYDAMVGDRGVQLSGGQRQRLAIARALVRRPGILILDEATSALDAPLESLVQQSLRAIDFHPTTIIIAHRLSTVARVDRVIVLDHGRIVETGTNEGLIETSAFYRQLVQTQLIAD